MKELTNLTPIDFIRNVRLKMAADLLTQKKQCVADIAYAVGFSNLSHFSRAFRNHYGTTPKKYSEKIQEKETVAETISELMN